MAVKNYLINDKWLDLDKQNIVEVKSTDGVIGSVKLNGEEYGGGGGESDFSTAKVTIISTPTGSGMFSQIDLNGAFPLDDRMYNMAVATHNGETVLNVALYKGKAVLSLYNERLQTMPILSGDVEFDPDDTDQFIVSGDCTISITLT